MGSFNVSCAISDLAIECEEMCYVIEVFDNYTTDTFVSGEYKPKHFPILAKYADYGNFEVIHNPDINSYLYNDTTGEAYTKIKLDYNGENLFPYMAIHKDIYDYLSKELLESQTWGYYDELRKQGYQWVQKQLIEAKNNNMLTILFSSDLIHFQGTPLEHSINDKNIDQFIIFENANEIAKFKYFQKNINDLNKRIKPSIYTGQETFNNAFSKYTKQLNKIINKKIKKEIEEIEF